MRGSFWTFVYLEPGACPTLSRPRRVARFVSGYSRFEYSFSTLKNALKRARAAARLTGVAWCEVEPGSYHIRNEKAAKPPSDAAGSFIEET